MVAGVAPRTHRVQSGDPMSGPSFSVAIPAWGSAPYVADAIDTIAMTQEPDVEVVVSVDPGSPDFRETLLVLENVSNLSFRVVQPPRPLSMAEHYEWCLKQVSGDFITILGADDGVMPWAFRLARRLLSEVPEAQALCFRRAYYFWPGVEWEYNNSRANVTSADSWSRVHGQSQFRRILRGQGEHFDLPQVYTNNFVRRDVIDLIRRTSAGLFYHERNPDVYSGVAVAHFADHIIRCETPAFWTGTSPSSMGLKQREAIVGRSESAMQSVQSDFVDRSAESGHEVAVEVGNDLWLTAQDSPIYVLSAFLRFRRVVGPLQSSCHPRRATVVAFSAAIARAAQGHKAGFSVQDQQAVDVQRLVQAQCSRLGISSHSVWLLSSLLRIMQHVRRHFRRIRKRAKSWLSPSASLQVQRLALSTEDGCARLREANELIFLHEKRLLHRLTK
jgi:hypothetical protein